MGTEIVGIIFRSGGRWKGRGRRIKQEFRNAFFSFRIHSTHRLTSGQSEKNTSQLSLKAAYVHDFFKCFFSSWLIGHFDTSS